MSHSITNDIDYIMTLINKIELKPIKYLFLMKDITILNKMKLNTYNAYIYASLKKIHLQKMKYDKMMTNKIHRNYQYKLYKLAREAEKAIIYAAYLNSQKKKFYSSKHE